MNIDHQVYSLIDMAIAEDLGPGDLTTDSIFSSDQKGLAKLVAREPMVISGILIARAVFLRIDERCRFSPLARDGEYVKANKTIARIQGPVGSLLKAERTALNFMRRLSGIATETRKFQKLLEEYPCTLLDTRKTTPGWRSIEKAAVRDGGGSNHRFGLFDGVMIKDNHIKAAGSIDKAIKLARQRIPPTIKIEVECESISQVRTALKAGADIIMLDNMSPKKMKHAVDIIASRAKTEASGGITRENLVDAAKSGVDYISVGALTHSAKSADIAMEI